MSLFNALYADDRADPTPFLTERGFADAPAPFWTSVLNALDFGFDVQRLGAREDRLTGDLMMRNKRIFDATGEKIRFNYRGMDFDAFNNSTYDFIRDPTSGASQAYEAAVDDLRRRFPEKMRAIETRDQLQANVSAKLNAIAERAQRSGADHPVGAFIGGTAATLADPINIALMMGTGGLGELPLLARAGAQGALWGAVAGIEAPMKMAEAEAVGGPAYTWADARSDVVMGFAGGVAGEFIGTGLKAGFKAGWARLKAFREAEDPALRAAGYQADQALLDHAAIGDADGPTTHAALDSLERGGPLPAVEPDRDIAALMPAGASETLYRGRRIYARSFDPADLEANPRLFQYKDGGDAQGVTPRLRGVEQWDPTASGKVIVWEAPDGKLMVADGHQRLGLAKRLDAKGFDPRLDGYLLRAADGWTARDVRVLAALKNIREGSGAILDAAKVFRDAPEALRDKSLPVTGEFMAQARGLARLSKEAFEAVVNKVIPERYGAEIGLIAGDRPDLHKGIVDLLHAAEPANADEARALVAEALEADWIKSEGETADLFGYDASVSAMIARARLAAAVQTELRRDARLFGNLIKNADAIEAGGNVLARDINEAKLAVDRAALSMVAKLALRGGPMGEAMAEAALRVAKGERLGAVARDVVGRLRTMVEAGEHLDQLRAEALTPEAPTPAVLEAAKAFDDPAGPGVQEQLKAKGEEAALEADPEAHIPGLFEDLPPVGNEAQAHARLKACAPGV